jgi:ABC-2 type transport system permease protein
MIEAKPSKRFNERDVVLIEGWRKMFTDLAYLSLEQLWEVRTNWYFFLPFSLFVGTSTLFGIVRFGSGLTDRNSLLYIVSGTMILLANYDGLVFLAQRIARMRQDGSFIYYASLPVSKSSFILALIFSRMITTVPGMLAPLIIAPLLYNVSFEFNPWMFIVFPLTVVSLSAVGMAMAFLIPSPEALTVITGAFSSLVVMVAPIFIPMHALPLPLQIFGYLFPPTYGADALRRLLNGSIDIYFYLDLLILSAASVVGFYILNHKLNWRSK